MPTVSHAAHACTDLRNRAPLVADPRVRACARHDLRQGADPIAVAALLEICVEDLYDALDYTPRRNA